MGDVSRRARVRLILRSKGFCDDAFEGFVDKDIDNEGPGVEDSLLFVQRIIHLWANRIRNSLRRSPPELATGRRLGSSNSPYRLLVSRSTSSTASAAVSGPSSTSRSADSARARSP